MGSAEVLRALEAELKTLDNKRAELARAIETIRRIIVVGKPETIRQDSIAKDGRETLADRAMAYIRAAGGRARMTAIVTAVGDSDRDQRSQYGSIYGALKNKAENDPTLTLVEPGVWQVK